MNDKSLWYLPLVTASEATAIDWYSNTEDQKLPEVHALRTNLNPSIQVGPE